VNPDKREGNEEDSYTNHCLHRILAETCLMESAISKEQNSQKPSTNNNRKEES